MIYDDIAVFWKCPFFNSIPHFSLEDKFTTTALERQYDSIHSYGNTYGDHKRFLEFSFEEYQTLLDFAKDDIGIPMIASAMDSASVDVVIDTFKMPFIKIGSGDSNNPILLEKVAKRSSVNAVISTGMSDMDDVHRIYKLFKKYRTQNNFIILHCTSSYPTAFNAVNLNVLIRYCLSDEASCYRKIPSHNFTNTSRIK